MEKESILFNVEGCIRYSDVKGVITWLEKAKKSVAVSDYDEIIEEVSSLAKGKKIELSIRENIRADLSRIQVRKNTEKAELERVSREAAKKAKRASEKARKEARKREEAEREEARAKKQQCIARIKNLFASRGIQHIYHFTDEENLPLIRKYGLLPYAELLRQGITPPKPGGSEISREVDRYRGLDEYVHLCLKDSHPMEYVARQMGRIGRTRFLRISTEVLFCEDAMGCSGVANRNDMSILPLEKALDSIDIDILFGGRPDFRNKEFQNRYNEAKKAEILIPSAIPQNLIKNLY